MKKKFTAFFIASLMVISCMTQSTYAKGKAKVRSISVNLPAGALTMKKGTSRKLKVKVKTSGKISRGYTIQTSNKRIVKISKGKLYALKNGKANVTLAAKGNRKVKKVIKVTVGQPVSCITIKKYKAVLRVGAQVKLKTSVGAKNASNKGIVWSTSNKKVMKINKNRIYMLKKGKANIRGTAADGSGKTASISMTVKDIKTPKTKKTVSKSKTKTSDKSKKTKSKRSITRKEAKTSKKSTKKKIIKKYLVIGTPSVPSGSGNSNQSNNSNTSDNNSGTANNSSTSDNSNVLDNSSASNKTDNAKKTYKVTFDSMGGSSVSEQTVTENECALLPSNPNKTDGSFLWWYKDDEYKPFAFNEEKINSDITLHAKWYDTTGSSFVDSDDDEIEDGMEKLIGTDPNKSDSDDDDISDEDEIKYGFDPTANDSDSNGIKDGDEDLDKDGLTTLEEIKNNTHPYNTDTDGDGLSDGDEVNKYKTDPTGEDTDGDGANDGYEVKVGTDPNEYDSSFDISVKADGNADVTSVSVNMSGDGELAQSVTINKNETGLINDKVPGYIGAAYDFSAKDTTNLDAKITFKFNKDILDNGEEPAIYYINPETYQLKEMDTDVDEEEGTAEADTTHFSTYVLLNKKSVDNAWNNDIDAPEITNPDDVVGLSAALVVDRSGSMDDNDPDGMRLDLTKNMIRKLTNKDLGSLVSFVADAEVVTPLTSDKDRLLDDVDTIENDDRTNYNSGTDCSEGLMEGMWQLSDDTSGNRRCVIMMTDGQDTESTYDYDNEVIPYAKKNKIHIYTIGLGDVDEDLLEKIASSTGGRYYYAEDSSSLEDVYKQATEDTISTVFVDENKDGISDQYVKWMTKQDQIINGGFNPFAGLSYDEIQSNADYDHDGLKNGDEISLDIDNDGYMCVSMSSNPCKADSDNDGLLDYYPVKKGDEEIAPPDAHRMDPVTPRGLWKYHINSVNSASENSSDNMPYAQKYKDLPSITDNPNIKKIINNSYIQKIVPNLAAAMHHIIKNTPLTDDSSIVYKSAHSIILVAKDITTTEIPKKAEQALKLKNDEVAMLQAYGGAAFLNFKPDEYNSALHALPDTWQKGYKYTENYDDIFHIGSNMNRRYIEFTNKDGLNYRIWQWKGDYWNLHTGAESGVYHIDKDDKDNEKPEDEKVFDPLSENIPMSLSLYHYSDTVADKSCVFHWSPIDKNQWWITGFNWRIMNPEPKDYALVTSMDFSTRTDLYDSLKNAMSDGNLSTDSNDHRIDEDTILFDDTAHKVWLAWKGK